MMETKTKRQNETANNHSGGDGATKAEVDSVKSSHENSSNSGEQDSNNSLQSLEVPKNFDRSQLQKECREMGAKDNGDAARKLGEQDKGEQTAEQKKS